ncbi:unnamed protein product [Brassica rapa subsp. trilocularis]
MQNRTYIERIWTQSYNKTLTATNYPRLRTFETPKRSRKAGNTRKPATDIPELRLTRSDGRSTTPHQSRYNLHRTPEKATDRDKAAQATYRMKSKKNPKSKTPLTLKSFISVRLNQKTRQKTSSRHRRSSPETGGDENKDRSFCLLWRL